MPFQFLPTLTRSAAIAVLAASTLPFLAGCRGDGDGTPQELMVANTAVMLQTLQDEVEDPARVARAGELLETLRDAELALFEDMRVTRERIQELNADYDTPRSEFEALAQTLDARRREFSDQLLEVHGGLRDCLEPEEWKALLVVMGEQEKRWEKFVR